VNHKRKTPRGGRARCKPGAWMGDNGCRCHKDNANHGGQFVRVQDRRTAVSEREQRQEIDQ